MATYNDNGLVWRVTSPTENYNWVKKISDGLTAVGLPIDTTVTGQIDLSGTTVAIPSLTQSQNKSMGFQVRKMESAGKPTIYIRIDFGVASPSSATYNTPSPTIMFRFGVSVTSAGVISGTGDMVPITSGWGYYSQEHAPASPRPLFLASDGQNYLTMVIDPSLVATTYETSSYVPLCFGLERTISDATMEYDSDGFVTIDATSTNIAYSTPDWPAYNVSTKFCIRNLVTSQSIISNSVPGQTPVGLTSSKLPGQTLLFPITVCTPTIKKPMRAGLFYFVVDMPGATEFQTTYYGQTMNFITGGRCASVAMAEPSYYSLAFRYQ